MTIYVQNYLSLVILLLALKNGGFDHTAAYRRVTSVSTFEYLEVFNMINVITTKLYIGNILLIMKNVTRKLSAKTRMSSVLLSNIRIGIKRCFNLSVFL